MALTKSTSGADTTYRYDLRNRLVGVDTSGDGHDEQVYAYDSAGNGTSKVLVIPHLTLECIAKKRCFY